MIYLQNDSSVSQRVFIPRNESGPSTSGHTAALQSKDYEITENGLTIIHPDPGYDGISGGSISVYVASTGYTPTHLNVEQNGLYVATGDTVYTGVTVDVSSEINNQTKEITLSMADTYTTKEFGIDVTPDSGYTGLDKVTVRTDFRVRPSIYAGKYTDNGEYRLNASSLGFDGVFEEYVFKVDVQPKLTHATFTRNDTFTPPSGYDGFNEVTVDVPTTTVLTMTQAQYDALPTHDNNTIYLIKD